jgi:probable H4MPT-linked C1 transfer pathway protein
VAAGKNDLQKLGNGELAYTGCLRTSVAAIINMVPVRGIMTQVSSELFAQSGDVHLVLGNITEEQYTAETTDGRGKTLSESFARLARVVCADVEMLSEQDLLHLAHYIYRSQIEQIAEALTQVYSRLGPNAKIEIPAVVTGLGKEFLARRAAEKAGVAKIVDLAEFFPEGAALASPAAGVVYMAATKIEGRTLKWTQ